MSLTASVARATLRQSVRVPARVARRCESTTAKATEAAKETASKATGAAKEAAANASQKASEVKSKASEGLSRVSSSAGSSLSSVAETASNTLSKIGGRTGQVIKLVESAIPPTVYYARVGLELGKLVVQGQKMSPPSISTFQTYFQRAIKGLSNPGQLLSSTGASASTPEGVMSSARKLSNTQLAAGAVVVAEVLGFFTIGEIIGRFKIVGYRSDDNGENGALNEH